MSTRARKRRHGGFSLVEMLAVIATTSVICTLATSLIITMFRAETRQSRDTNQRLAIQRLGDRFRDDVHAAVALDVPNDAKDVLFELRQHGDTVITYRRLGAMIVWEKQRGGKVTAHDTFGISRDWRAAVESIEPDASTMYVRLVLDRDVANGASAPQHWQFDATLGSDHRYGDNIGTTE